MKAIVLEVFIDKEGVQREIGEEIDIDATRAENLHNRNLVKLVDTVAEKSTTRRRTTARK